jgi:hypothetical protein
MEYFFGFLGFLFIMSFIVHFAAYFYLEIANGYDSFPFFKVGFNWFAFYDKKVKPQHAFIVKMTNFTLRVMILVFIIGILSPIGFFVF